MGFILTIKHWQVKIWRLIICENYGMCSPLVLRSRKLVTSFNLGCTPRPWKQWCCVIFLLNASMSIKGTHPRVFHILNVIRHGVDKLLVNGVPFEDVSPCRIYRTIACVYPTYLHFDTRLLHTATMEVEKVARKRVQERLPWGVWLNTNERTYLEERQDGN